MSHVSRSVYFYYNFNFVFSFPSIFIHSFFFFSFRIFQTLSSRHESNQSVNRSIAALSNCGGECRYSLRKSFEVARASVVFSGIFSVYHQTFLLGGRSALLGISMVSLFCVPVSFRFVFRLNDALIDCGLSFSRQVFDESSDSMQDAISGATATIFYGLRISRSRMI